MAHQTGLEEYPVLLECGHFNVHAIDGETHMICGECIEIAIAFGAEVFNVNSKIMAFETREWHVKCQHCPAGRWTGKDRAAARRFKATHGYIAGHRQIVIDFMRPEHVKRTWRKHYGRKKVPAPFIRIPIKEDP
jgi:hypothetical protein